VELARNDVRPSHILTRAAFTNAIRTLHAIGGSTNAVIHLVAIAGRLGIDLPLPVFDELSDSTPLLLNLKPSGAYLMEDFEYAGGAPTLLAELAPLLDTSCLTVSGKSLGENVAGARNDNRDVIRSLESPLRPDGGLCVLHGSLAPRGAVIKRSAASPNLLRHRGRAIVFDGHDDLEARIDDPNLDVCADDVLVLRGAGPLGAPGMPEWGVLPIPQKLLKAGVRDMVRISDARISGTASGTVVVHISPESAAGGPLAAVQTGDTIALDVPARKLELLVPPEEIERRLSARSPDQRRAGDRQRTANPPEATAPSDPRQQNAHRGYRWLVTNHILQADQGCDFDFLRADFEG
jgi:dihydroxy-acid dehydratase